MGRASGRGYNRNRNNLTNENKNKTKNEKEMKFAPHYMNTKGKFGTVDVVLECIQIKLQQQLKYGSVIAKTLGEDKNDEHFGYSGLEPKRKEVKDYKDYKEQITLGLSDTDKFKFQLRQNGYDIHFKIDR